MMCRRAAIPTASLLLSLACVPARGGGFLDQVGNALGAVQDSTESTMHAVGEQASSVGKQAEGLGSSIASQVAPALASAQNSTMSAIDGVKDSSETAVVKALLWASGKCPELWKLLPGAPAQLAQKLSEAFASTEESPSASKASCRAAAQAGLEGIVDGEMGDASDQEKLAVKISLRELTGKVCTDGLMEALETMEEIRRDHREQYRMAIGDRLLLRVITEDALRGELAGYCGDDGADAAEVSGLFAGRPAVGVGASAPLGPVALLAAAAVLLTASVVAARRCSCSVARLLLGRDVVDEAERGLVDLVE